MSRIPGASRGCGTLRLVQTNGFLEAINGLFQAATRRARRFTRIATIRTVIFLIAGRLDFQQSTLMLDNPLEIHQSHFCACQDGFDCSGLICW